MTAATSDPLDRRDEIVKLAAAHGASDLRVFGSSARRERHERSDLDLLVQMEDGRSLLDLVALSQEFEDLLGVHVDVFSEGGLSPHVRDRILGEAVPL